MIPAHKHLVQWGLDKGYTIEVCCEAETDYEGTDYDEAIKAIEATEYGAIHLIEGTDTEAFINRMAWFSYVFDYDQEPNEIINDYGINEITEQWSKDYDEFYENCEVRYIYNPSNN